MIYGDWQSFRRAFTSPVAVANASATYTFAVGPPATITRAVTGDWDTAGFEPGMTAFVSGTTLNDGEYLIDTVTAAALTLAAGSVVEAEVAGIAGTEIRGFVLDADRMERWPVELVRSGGLAAITGVPTPYTGSPLSITLTANAGAADAAYGVDDFDWYLSGRTDDRSLQYFNALAKPSAWPSSYSGTAVLTVNAAAVLAGVGWNGTAATLTPALNVKLFKYTDVYVRRVSDGAIQWLNLLRAMQASA